MELSLEHRFLTGGPWSGSKESGLTNLSIFGSSSGLMGGSGIHEDHFIILGVHRSKKVKNHCYRGILYFSFTDSEERQSLQSNLKLCNLKGKTVALAAPNFLMILNRVLSF